MNIGDPERGSALVAVLLVATLIGTLIGVIVSASVVERRIIIDDIQKWKAWYAAEAGLHVAIAASRSSLPGETVSISDPGGTWEARAMPYGAYMLIESVGRVGRQNTGLRGWVGTSLVFDAAIISGHDAVSLTIAEETVIRGDIYAGQAGVIVEGHLEEGPIGSARSGPVHQGVVHLVPSPRLPPIPPSRIPESRMMVRNLTQLGVPPTRFEGGTTIKVDDLAVGRAIFAEGDLFLDCEGRPLPDGSIILSTGRIQLRGYTGGRHVLLVGDEGVDIGPGRATLHAISRGHLRIRSGAVLDIPSTATVADSSGQLTIDGTIRGAAVVGGLSLSLPDPVVASAPALRLGESAIVEGVVASARPCLPLGRVEGTLMCSAFLSDSDGRLRSARLDRTTIDLPSRHDGFVGPSLLGPNDRLILYGQEAIPVDKLVMFRD